MPLQWLCKLHTILNSGTVRTEGQLTHFFCVHAINSSHSKREHVHFHRFQLQDRAGVQVAAKDHAQGQLCIGVEFINYAQARQLEVTKGQGGDAGSVAKYSEYSLTLKVHGSRGMLNHLRSGMRKGLYVEARYGTFSPSFQGGQTWLLGCTM